MHCHRQTRKSQKKKEKKDNYDDMKATKFHTQENLLKQSMALLWFSTSFNELKSFLSLEPPYFCAQDKHRQFLQRHINNSRIDYKNCWSHSLHKAPTYARVQGANSQQHYPHFHVERLIPVTCVEPVLQHQGRQHLPLCQVTASIQ